MSKFKIIPICICLLVSLSNSQDSTDTPQKVKNEVDLTINSDSLNNISPWDKYELQTLHEIREDNYKAVREEGASIFLTGNEGCPSKIKVKYLGKKRDITSPKKTVIWLWIKTFGGDERFLDLFTKEVLVSEEKKKYWIPIQKQLIPYLDNEIQVGEDFYIYIRWPGASVGTFTTNWTFIINEFKKIKE